MASSSNQDNKIELELLKKDVNIITNLCEKFDKTIDKMQEIASNLSRMVSLQEQRIETQESVTKEVQSVLEMRRIEHNNDIKELHSRITTVNRELSEKIEESENKILKELAGLKAELIKDKKTFGGRLSDIEAWKYTMVGGLMVVTWILAKVDILKVLFGH